MENFLDFLFNYGLITLSLIVLTIFCAVRVYDFAKQSPNRHLEMIRKWLIVACIEVEKELGSKTGELKLLTVYTMFTSKFKWISRFLSFEQFSFLVDEALVTVRKMIETNPQVMNYVKK